MVASILIIVAEITSCLDSPFPDFWAARILQTTNLPLLTNLDAEKNKYFKIVADPAALYSKTAVRKRKADEVVATEAARVEKANRERVTRSRVVKKLDREIGRGDGRLDVLKEFVGGWMESNTIERLHGMPKWRVFDVDVRSERMVYCGLPLPFSVKGLLADYQAADAADGMMVEFEKLPRLSEHTYLPSWGGARNSVINSMNFSACGEMVLTTSADPPWGRNVSVAPVSSVTNRTCTPFPYQCHRKARRGAVHNSQCLQQL